jgi:membrane-bound serine protease (ClpP class)
MEFLQNPDVVYLLLAGGLIFAFLALVAPGTGFLEIGVFCVLGLAGWGVIQYDIPINWFAFIILLIGIVLFLLAIRKPKMWILLIASIAAIVLGSAFIFRSKVWYIPAVNPFLATLVSVLSGVFFWVAARKVIESRSTRPRHDLEALVGAIGEAKTRIHTEGSVQIAGELWSARSEKPILSGARVRVIDREGFTLLVESANQTENLPE